MARHVRGWDPVWAWRFIRASKAYRDAWEKRRPEPGLPERAPFPVRMRTDADAGAMRWGILAWEDPDDPHGPLAPFWATAGVVAGEVSRCGSGAGSGSRRTGIPAAGWRGASSAATQGRARCWTITAGSRSARREPRAERRVLEDAVTVFVARWLPWMTPGGRLGEFPPHWRAIRHLRRRLRQRPAGQHDDRTMRDRPLVVTGLPVSVTLNDTSAPTLQTSLNERPSCQKERPRSLGKVSASIAARHPR